jgi:hypothetical protein
MIKENGGARTGPGRPREYWTGHGDVCRATGRPGSDRYARMAPAAALPERGPRGSSTTGAGGRDCGGEPGEGTAGIAAARTGD